MGSKIPFAGSARASLDGSGDGAPEPRPPWRVAAVLFAIAGIVVAVRVFRSDEPEVTPATGPSAAASQSASAAATASGGFIPTPSVLPPRCSSPSSNGFLIGEAPKQKPDKEPGGDAGSGEPEDDPNAPFAVEVGRGAVFDGGFALGALRDAEGGTVAMIATLGVDGQNGKLVRLGRARGDLDPPVVAGAGASVLTALVEPNAGGRAIKLAKVVGEQVGWGAEFKEGMDESMALDLAVAGSGRAAITWDDLSPDGKHSVVMLASFDSGSMGSVSPPKIASGDESDADTPRLVARPGGFWLAWLVRGKPPEPVKPNSKKKKPAKSDDANSEEEDTDTNAGEAIDHRWVEIAPLDESAVAAGAPIAVTPKDGNVLAFDIAVGKDGAALVSFRDDDTPSGAGGGRVGTAMVRVGGAVETRPLHDDTAGAGAPTLLFAHGASEGFLAMTSLAGRAYLASVNSEGRLLEPLEAEAALGNGEVLAASGGLLLVGRQSGRAMELKPFTCTPRPAKAEPAR